MIWCNWTPFKVQLKIKPWITIIYDLTMIIYDNYVICSGLPKSWGQQQWRQALLEQ